MERRGDNEYLPEMLAEFDDLVIVETTSAQETIELISAGQADLVLVDLLDTRANGPEVSLAVQSAGETGPRLLAVIPRDSSHESIVALSRSFELHIARHGEPLDQVVLRLAASPTQLLVSACPEGVAI